ncbi:MAG: hypothetical protein OHK0019_11240 [Saprospiraceae bacterium]
MNKLHGSIPYFLVTEYKQWWIDDSNIVEVYKWGEGFYAYRHLIKEGDSFIEKEVRAVTKIYYDSLPQAPIQYS